MALETWPEALNNLAQRGTFAHKPGDPNVRTDMDGPVSRSRKRFTSTPNVYQFQVLMYSWEKITFDAWFNLLINSGADWYTMPVVVGNDYLNATVRITKDGISWSDAGFDKFTLSLSIEIRDLPTLTAVEAYLVGTYGLPSIFDPIQVAINQTYPHAWNGVITYS